MHLTIYIAPLIPYVIQKGAEIWLPDECI